MSVLLKDGSSVEDGRLTRIVEFDPRSKNFPITAAVKSKKQRSYTWRCLGWLDQGSEGSCVGHGVAHELIARPAEAKNIDHKYAKETIYWEAQKIDPWPGGSYPGAEGGNYEGTSVLAGVKIAQKLGWFDSYRWAFSLEDLILGVGHNGPAVMGVKWFTGMLDPDDKGFIHPIGNKVGGHCLLNRAVNVRDKFFTLRNSWDKDWGINGDCYISFDNMDKLLHQSGEAVFFLKRHRKV